MQEKEQSVPWGKLISLTTQLVDVDLVKDSYQIGRKALNDIIVEDVRLSGVHCKIYKGPEDECWIEDLSTNGTFIEGEKIGQGKKRKLASGDKIYILNGTNANPDEILGYTFSCLTEIED